ncbi:hypothetical protein V5O48_013061 [Marasmius crinis-equi]|uniref:Uncharacterized protein n=1 Tax=Marasmius crinis-equi TaxID=585013 RepID=A0ABR3F149_9AGAR
MSQASSPRYYPESPVMSNHSSTTSPPDLESVNSRNASPEYVSSDSSDDDMDLETHYQSLPSWTMEEAQRHPVRLEFPGPVLPDEDGRDRLHTVSAVEIEDITSQDHQAGARGLPRTPKDHRLPLSLPFRRLLTSATGVVLIVLAWQRDPHLTYSGIFHYLQVLLSEPYEPPIPGAIPIPCVHAMPSRYRFTVVPNDNTYVAPRSPMNPLSFYRIASQFALSTNRQQLLSPTTRRPFCVRDCFRVFRTVFYEVAGSSDPTIVSLARGPWQDLVSKVEQLTGYSFLDAHAYSAFLINGYPELDPIQLGLLGGDSWLKEHENGN